MTTKTNKTTNATQDARLDRLTAEVDRCLDELRTLPTTRRYAARRAMIQRLYADLGDEMRQIVNR